MKKKGYIIFSLIILWNILPAKIEGQNYAIAVKLNTLGANFEVMRSFGESFNLRAGTAFFSYKSSRLEGNKDYSYEAELSLSSISVLADYFPFSGAFRITSGLIFNLNSSTINLYPEGTYTVGNDVYDQSNLGTLKADVEFNKVAPYIGIGFGNPTAGRSGIGFDFSIGTMYQGSPIVDLTADGLLAPSASADQEEQIESNLSWFKWYPVLSLGLTYKF